MEKQVFLGGACGATDWRRRIAIPLLEGAGVTYYDPQLGVGEWTPAREDAEMEAKNAAEVLLYVVSRETRGVASIAEAAHALGSGRAVSLAIEDLGPSDLLDGKHPTSQECDDLNRGRIFVRTMARLAGVPVFSDVESAVRHAIHLVHSHLSVATLRDVLAEVAFKQSRFVIEPCANGFLIQLQAEEPCAATGEPRVYAGRKWHISDRATPSDIVRTAFKAVVTWEEHEAREHFRYRGAAVFGPHCDIDDLVEFMQPTGPTPRSNPNPSNSAGSPARSLLRADHR